MKTWSRGMAILNAFEYDTLAIDIGWPAPWGPILKNGRLDGTRWDCAGVCFGEPGAPAGARSSSVLPKCLVGFRPCTRFPLEAIVFAAIACPWVERVHNILKLGSQFRNGPHQNPF
jgi:hypothetical protein